MIGIIAGVLGCLVPQPAELAKPEPAPAASSLVSFPHPLITEILYAVPTGTAGDANGDGKRDVNGDEFVELVNPHDKPIQLAGYVIADRELGEGEKKFTSIRFKFPACELKPGEVVVVFNGHDQTWTGPIGDAAKAPASGNDKFHNARVFTMGLTNAKQGLANKGDCIQLIAPDGKVIHCIKWGDAPEPKGAGRVETAPLVTRQSVQRASRTGPLEPHAGDGFSPGLWGPAPASSETPAEPKPTPEPGPTQKKPASK